jgi:hypothetical protein
LALLLQEELVGDVRAAEVSLLQCKYDSIRGAAEPVMSLPEELRHLCELASREMNPEKLLALVQEIDRLFHEYERKQAISKHPKR